MINVLQLIVRVPLVNLHFPANIQIIFSLIVDITNFNLFETGPLQ